MFRLYLISSIGSVWKGTWQGKAVALKQLGDGEIEGLGKEGENLKKLNHPNIVKFWGIYKGFLKKRTFVWIINFWKIENETYFICIEYISGGSLEDYLFKKEMERK